MGVCTSSTLEQGEVASDDGGIDGVHGVGHPYVTGVREVDDGFTRVFIEKRGGESAKGWKKELP